MGGGSFLGSPPLPLSSLPAGRKQFARHEWAQKAAYLLGCNLEELSSAIFKQQPKGSLQRSTSFRQGPEEAGLADGSGEWAGLGRAPSPRGCRALGTSNEPWAGGRLPHDTGAPG